MAYNSIQKFRFWTNKVLPLVYDDSLSYYEVLAKTVDYLNSCIESIDYLMEIYAPVTAEVAQIRADLDSFKETTEAALIALNQKCRELEEADKNNYEALKNYVDNINTALINEITALSDAYNTLLTLYGSFKSYSDSGDVVTLNASKRYTDDKIRDILKYIEDPKIWFVIDPIDNELKDIQTVINEMFDLLRWGAFTCVEFDGMGYTCSYIDSIGYTASEFDYYGRLRFMFSLDFVTRDELANYATLETLENYALKTDLNGVAYKEDLVIYNPMTGLQSTFQQVINALASFHQNGNTCTELDNSAYDAYGYDNIGFSAYDFDFYGIIL